MPASRERSGHPLMAGGKWRLGPRNAFRGHTSSPWVDPPGPGFTVSSKRTGSRASVVD